MKIDAQFLGLDRTGGVAVLLRYLDALQAAGDQITITTLGAPDPRRFMEPSPGIDTTYVGLRGPVYRGLARTVPGGLGYPTRELTRLERASGPTDLRVATYSFTVHSAMALDAPVLHHVQHFEVLMEPPGRRRELARSALLADVYRTANCTWVANELDAIGSDVRGIVPPAIDHDVFRPDLRRAPACGDPSRPLRILTLGKAMDWKGLVDVVGAASLLQGSADRPIELVTYGANAPQLPTGVVGTHHGLVGASELAALCAEADVSVSASWYESFPLPPLEAMACGTPVVCTRLGTEDYAIDEVNCLVVPAKDPEAIARAVTRIAMDSDLRRELVRNGMATAARHHWHASEELFIEHTRHAVA